MRALSQFVMRGPLQAGAVAAVTTAVPFLFWIGAAVVGLVILRLGVSQGLNVGLWALLPALGWSWYGSDPTALSVLLMTALMAAVLRSTASWERTLLSGSVLALVTGFILPAVFAGKLDQLAETGVSFYQQVYPEVASELGDRLNEVIRNTINASLAGTYLAVAIGSTVLARYWQAGLYNPGGFRQEFHNFRLSRWASALCGIAMIVAPVTGLNPLLVAWVAGLPLLVAAIALVHGTVALKSGGSFWLVMFYVALAVMGWTISVLLLLLAFVDSWLDIRGRIKRSGPAE
ncbi:hypothetical protein SAMN05216203_2662 [Marinobacter daqiaonensis]|uniref:Membrane protein (DUF2232) n=1 Tax=Marinobacter daqiaonensis TaxID=650891 RepID=A0A1I6J520_9GAMM|nr:hypothetical protein [Marinobacter daqiaonensis]SFR74073.1 hypothetical protein SAMN05216203_2662 [Marinobacter daqiaonensis]